MLRGHALPHIFAFLMLLPDIALQIASSLVEFALPLWTRVLDLVETHSFVLHCLLGRVVGVLLAFDVTFSC